MCMPWLLCQGNLFTVCVVVLVQLEYVKVSSYIARYLVLGLFKALFTSPPGRPVHK